MPEEGRCHGATDDCRPSDHRSHSTVLPTTPRRPATARSLVGCTVPARPPRSPPSTGSSRAVLPDGPPSVRPAFRQAPVHNSNVPLFQFPHETRIVLFDEPQMGYDPC